MKQHWWVRKDGWGILAMISFVIETDILNFLLPVLIIVIVITLLLLQNESKSQKFTVCQCHSDSK